MRAYRAASAFCAALMAGVPLISTAQSRPDLPPNYPSKPIRVLVGASPGGGTDLVARMVTQKLAERWNATVIVDNRAGGAGVVSMNSAAQAARDGHTLVISGNSFIMIGAQRSVPYDIRTTFDGVVQLTSQPYLVVVNAALPVNTVQELISYAKAKQGQINYGSSGTGSVIHLGIELLNSIVGVRMVHVPYKGIGPAVVDAASGNIQMLYANGIAVASFLKSGRLRAIAVSSGRRMKQFPSLPTMAESGVAGYELDNMYAVYAPAGVASPILNAIHREFGLIVNSQEISDRLAADGAEAAASNTRAEFHAKYVKEVDKWERFLKSSGIKLD